jgi:hypothetical protein
MNYIIKRLIQIYEYFACVKKSKLSEMEIESYDVNMEYYIVQKNNPYNKLLYIVYIYL